MIYSRKLVDELWTEVAHRIVKLRKDAEAIERQYADMTIDNIPGPTHAIKLTPNAIYLNNGDTITRNKR